MLYEMRKDAIENIIDVLADGYSGYYCDLHNEVFNTDYYVDSNTKAKEMLGDDVYYAIGRIYDYEKDNFGEVYTDLSEPMKIVNMLYYIIGEDVMYECGLFNEPFMDDWNNLADEETNQKMIDALEKELENL